MYRYRERRYTAAGKRFLLLLVLCTVSIALLVICLRQLRPIVSSLATARVSNAVTRIVNDSVNELLYGNDVSYDHLISFEKDQSGSITAIKSNMAELNRLQSAVLRDVLQKLGEVSTKELSIPLGSLTGSPLLAGRGPAVHVRMQSIGTSSAHFENEFVSTGINQTQHRLMLVIDVSVSILLPGFTTYTKVSNNYSVAETVLVGSVPENYTYFKSSASIDDLAKEYIMNNG